MLAERHRLAQDRAHRRRGRRVADVDGARQELLAPLVRHPHDRRVEIEHLDDRARERIERLVEPEALREGARDLVERANLACRGPLGGERRLALLPEAGRLLVELGVPDGDRELPGERGQQRRLVLARRRPAFRIRGKQPHHFPERDKRNGERRADAGLARCRRDAREPQVSHDVRDLEHRPLTRGPERDVEQAIGDACVRAGETPTRRLFELALPRAPEVDGHAVHVEQLGDALDGGLECVRDGELRCRLHDHLEQCPGALELERKQPRPLAGAQGVRSADAERREPRELLRLGLVARGMEQLQDAERRPSQRKRGRDGAILRQPRGMSTDRTGLGERALRDVARSSEIGAGVGPPRGGRDQPVLAALPEDGGRCAGDAGGEADDLGGGVILLQRDRERFAGELERRPRERGDVAVRREGAEDESRLGGTELGGEPLLGAERLAGTQQLERDGGAVRPARHEQKARGAGLLGDAAHGGRRSSQVVERRVRELRRRQHGPVELGRERPWRCDGDRLEPLAAVVECPDERDLGARDCLRGLRERAERIGRARRARRSRDRANERCERRGSETDVLRIEVEKTGHCGEVFRPERAGDQPASVREAGRQGLPDRAATHRARWQHPLDDCSVAAVTAAELAGDLRSRHGKLHESGVVERQLDRRRRPLRGHLELNLYVLHRLFVLGEGATPCAPVRFCAHTAPVQTPEPARPFRARPERPPRPEGAAPVAGSWGVRLAWVSGLVLTLSAFTDWYTGTLPNGQTLAVTGWHTGALGKLVFFIGLATLILEASRAAGIVLPAAVPDRLILIALGALAVIFVLIRLISVPDTYFVATARGIGLYVSLLGALGLLGAGLLRTAEDLP